VLPIIPVEDTDLIGAVGCTFPCAYTAVVHLQIDIFRQAVHCCIDRADRLARSRMTLLAHHRDKAGSHMRVLPFPVPLDPDPMHASPIRISILAHPGQIILHGTCSYTGSTARAAVQINDHPPFSLRFFRVLLHLHLPHFLISLLPHHTRQECSLCEVVAFSYRFFRSALWCRHKQDLPPGSEWVGSI
jgi:hypothetical protein